MSKSRSSSSAATMSIQEQMLQVLQRVKRHGNFVCHGRLPPTIPGLEIAKVGEIGFPLTSEQAIAIRDRHLMARENKLLLLRRFGAFGTAADTGGSTSRF